MLFKKISLIFISALLLVSCSLSPNINPSSDTISSEEEEDLLIRNITLLGVYDEANIEIVNKYDDETFIYQIPNDNVRIENDKVIALRGNNKTTVNVTSSRGRSGSFVITTRHNAYKSTHETAENNEGWFNDVNIAKVDSMTSEFANGIDISSMKQLYDNGQRFYDKNGNETALTLLLKDNGVNWVRLRLWVEPYDTYIENGVTKKFLYGGGNCSLENVIWMAKEAKLAGLKVLLNFHYSDFYTDPSNQIIPKSWKNISTSDALAFKVKEYTKETLLELKKNNALPDAVALGNEIYNGLFAHNPGGITTSPKGDAPNYVTGKSERQDGTEAKYDHTSSKTSTVNSNLRKYLNAGIEAVNEVDSKILTMVHFVKGLTASDQIVTFFHVIEDLDIDIYAISAYSYYHFSNITTLRNNLQYIANEFPNKKICIAETSYGFTFEYDQLANNTFSQSGTCKPQSGYPASVQGQASMIRDTTEVVANLSNGWGLFYWEGAWTPTKLSGWADEASKASWSNQALVSYNGKALGSLSLYKKMLGN